MNKLIIKEGSIAPFRAYKGDAGLDLFIQEDTIIPAGTAAKIKAGVAFDLEEGYYVEVISRSSASFNFPGLIVLPTVVDHGYKGEISTVLQNVTSKDLTVKKGDRLAQALLIQCHQFDNELTMTDKSRGTNDFGSSGKGK